MDERMLERLRRLDETLATIPLPPGLHARVLGIADRRGRRIGIALACVAVAAALLLTFQLGRRSVPAAAATPIAALQLGPPTTTAPPLPAQHFIAWDDRLVADAGCELVGTTTIDVRNECRLHLEDPSMTIDVWAHAQIEPSPHGLRVRDGVALFHVDPVAPGRPRVRIEVEAGVVEVIGTRFVVAQDAKGGYVDLLEGRITFTSLDGTTRDVAPGQRLRWEGRRVIGPPRPRRESTGTRAAPAVDLDAALERVAELRRAGRHRDAVVELVRLRRRVTDEAVAEVLSFEEGTLRSHTDRRDDVCAFWRGHLARFGPGGHAASIAARMDDAGCPAG